MDSLLVLLLAALLIAAIAWWFYGPKTGSATEADQSGKTQAVTIVVDGGYKPGVVTLRAGKPAVITFLRKDPSGCLAEIIMPDFNINTKLPVNEPFDVTVQPDTKGTYTYTCGMRMFSGTIEVV